jgi:hypothetical protein
MCVAQGWGCVDTVIANQGMHREIGSKKGQQEVGRNPGCIGTLRLSECEGPLEEMLLQLP